MTDRAYVAHRWIATDGEEQDAMCLACGITGDDYDDLVEHDSLLNWDCKSVRERI